MFWPLTLIGAGVGYAVASIPGALLGALLGQAADRRLELRGWAQLKARLGGRPVPRDDEVLFMLLGRLAKSDGRVLQAHIHQARVEMQRLEMSEPARQRAIGAFNRGRDGRDRLQGLLKRFKNQPDTVEGLLRACWRMAWADGRASVNERGLIVRWGGWLGWPAPKVEALASADGPPKVPAMSPDQAYKEALRVLGVGTNEPAQDIKRAYRRLLSRHHPDKLAGSGATPAQVREATDKTRELHNAYAAVRERHGF